MRAMVLREPSALPQLEDVAEPAPGPGEVVVEVAACGFGLTVRDKLRRIDARHLPRIPGHELVGRVVDRGPGASLPEGQRVAAYYYLYCGVCRRCREGRQSLCADSGGRIGEDRDGGFAEQVAVPESSLVTVPEGVDDVALTVACDALSTPVHVVRRSGLRAGDRLLIVGAAGGVGVHLVQLARHHRAEVAAVDLGAEKLAALQELGAEPVDAADPSWVDAQRGRVDVAVDLVGTEETMTAAYGTLTDGGTLVRMVSYRSVSLAGLAPGVGMGERTITGSRYCGVDELRSAVELLARGAIHPVVSDVRPLAEFGALCDLLDRGAVVGRTAVIPR